MPIVLAAWAIEVWCFYLLIRQQYMYERKCQRIFSCPDTFFLSPLQLCWTWFLKINQIEIRKKKNRTSEIFKSTALQKTPTGSYECSSPRDPAIFFIYYRRPRVDKYWTVLTWGLSGALEWSCASPSSCSISLAFRLVLEYTHWIRLNRRPRTLVSSFGRKLSWIYSPPQLYPCFLKIYYWVHLCPCLPTAYSSKSAIYDGGVKSVRLSHS